MSPADRPSIRARLRPVFFMFTLTLVFMSAVTAAHLATRDLVARNQALHLKRAILRAAGHSVPDRPTDVEALYTQHARPFTASPDGAHAAVRTPSGKDTLVFLETGAGLWGPIEAAVAFQAADLSLAGLAFTAHNETPGLGARIEDDAFRAQFPGQRPPLALTPRGARPGPGQFDAITGATISSQAVRDIVNRAAERARDHVPLPTAPDSPELLLP